MPHKEDLPDASEDSAERQIWKLPESQRGQHLIGSACQTIPRDYASTSASTKSVATAAALILNHWLDVAVGVGNITD